MIEMAVLAGLDRRFANSRLSSMIGIIQDRAWQFRSFILLGLLTGTMRHTLGRRASGSRGGAPTIRPKAVSRFGLTSRPCSATQLPYSRISADVHTGGGLYVHP